MAEVKILIEGFVSIENKIVVKDCSSVVLVKTEDKNIIFDPGIDRERLLAALSQEGLQVEDITHVFLSHTHIDHCMLMGIFPKALILKQQYWYRGINEGLHQADYFGKDVTIIPTPGHIHDHNSLLVKTTKGKILLAGDLFWWDVKEEQQVDYDSLLNHEDIFAKDKRKLRESRKKVLEMVDYIIPGHGKMFKNTRR